MNIEFIPLLELPTIKDESSKIIPTGTSFNNPVEWDFYWQKEIKRNYENPPDPISSGIYQYRLFDIGIADLKKAIDLHVGDLHITESCSLFGGYAISVNGKIELFPQCCGALAEIQQWKNLLDGKFMDFYLPECHPSPQITKRENNVIINCADDYEPFIPLATRKEIKLDYLEIREALIITIGELKEFSLKMDELSNQFGSENISEILIWGGKNSIE